MSSGSRKLSWPPSVSILAIRDRLPERRHQRDELARLGGGKEPIARKRDDEPIALRAAERVEPLRSRVPHVKVVHRERDGHVRVGIEAAHKLLTLVGEVRPDGESFLEVGDHVAGGVAVEVELSSHRLRGQVGDVTEHPGERETCFRKLVGAVVLPSVKGRVGLDRVAANDIERDRLCGDSGGTCNRDSGLHILGIARRPAQGLMGPERTADHRAESSDAEQVDEAFLYVDHVLDGDEGEIAAVREVGCRVDGGRACRSPAPSEDVRADHEQTIGIDCLPGPDEAVPPAGVVVLVMPRQV